MSVQSVPADRTPLEQSVRLAFLVLAGITAFLGVIWVTGNIRSVPTDATAVVTRYGRVISEQHSGLVLALPRPFEEVRFFPSPDHQLSLHVTRDNTAYSSDETDLELQESDDFFHMEKNRDAANSSYLLTGDGSVVRLDATLSYRVVRPPAYMLSQPHIQPALRRLFYAAATEVAAAHPIEDFLVVHADSINSSSDGELLSARRAQARTELLRKLNERLQRLLRDGTDAGVEITRIDLVAILPPRAKEAFDQVLTAEQAGAQSMASAQTVAERTIQEANAERDRIRANASAAAEERIRQATTGTASILAEENAVMTASRDVRNEAALRAWRERVVTVLSRAGTVTLIPANTRQMLLSPPVAIQKRAPSSEEDQ